MSPQDGGLFLERVTIDPHGEFHPWEYLPIKIATLADPEDLARIITWSNGTAISATDMPSVQARAILINICRSPLDGGGPLLVALSDPAFTFNGHDAMFQHLPTKWKELGFDTDLLKPYAGKLWFVRPHSVGGPSMGRVHKRVNLKISSLRRLVD
jgi:hypothetical protein